MANPVSSRMQDASNNNILSTLQATKNDAVRNDGFSRALENSARSQDRPAASRPEQTPPREVNRAESRTADKAGKPADSSTTAQSESTGSKLAAEQKTTAADDTSTTEAASDTEETGVETAPANLAVLASIIAALDKAATAQAPTEAEDDLLGSTRSSAGSVLSGLLEKSAGKGGEATKESAGSVLSGLLEKSAGKGGEAARDAAVKDAASALAADAKQLKADAGTISGNFSRLLATIAQPQVYSAPAASALQALAADPSAVPGAMPNTVVPGMRTEQSGIPQLQIHTPTGQRVWAEEVGNRLMFMVGRGESRAELVLTPPSLGRLGVSIQINGDQTTAHFVASSSAAREALEQALPRLREALQQAGINLGQTDVSTSNERHTAANGEQNGRGASSSHRGGSDSASGDVELAPQHRWTQAGSGLIDTFA